MDNNNKHRASKNTSDSTSGDPTFTFPKTSYTHNNQSPHKGRRDDKWADSLTWEILPGAECPGCKRSNHNVYRTGCPAFAQFALCQDFYNKCPPKELETVKTSFLKYQ